MAAILSRPQCDNNEITTRNIQLLQCHIISWDLHGPIFCLLLGISSGLSNLACDWLSIVWAYSEQEIENGPWSVAFQMMSDQQQQQ